MNNTLSLQQLFNNRIFSVPDYQRGYAWEKQQVEEFLDDLEVLSSKGHHYTGTIVLLNRHTTSGISDNEGTSFGETDVVDGQQRLTTVVLLLNEICRALDTYDGSHILAQGIHKKYVKGTSIDNQPLYKLSLNKDTDTFFRDGVLPDAPGVEEPPIVSAKRLLNAKRQIAKYLSKAISEKEDSEQWLRELHSKVTNRLQFNLYEVEHAAEVGIIFEVMNDRGKPLTNLEKVKNYLLYVASNLEVAKSTKDEFTTLVNNAWSVILQRLMVAGLSFPADEDQLLRFHWLMRYDHRSRKWDGAKSVKSRFNLRKYQGNHSGFVSALTEYVEGLRAVCTCYCDARVPTREGAFKSFDSVKDRNLVRLWSSKLVRIGVEATFLPLLMAVRIRWPGDPEKYLEVVRHCELFAFRFYQIARFYSHFGQTRMYELAHDTNAGRIDFSEVMKRIKQIYSHTDERRAFGEFTDATTPRDWYNRRGLKYFLYEYEEYRASASHGSPKVNWDEIQRKDSIEHVLPQSISSQPYWKNHFKEDDHREYLHDIGNLTLTKGNSELGNKAFPDKKGTKTSDSYCYENSLLVQEKDLSKWDNWTIGTINERRSELLNWAKKRWHADFNDVDATDTDDEETGEA